jgi:hypothetical protein
MLTVENIYADYALGVLENAFADLTTSLTDASGGKPITDYELYQNFPNPFNPVTNIRFTLPQTGFVVLEIFDLTGRKVQTLTQKRYTKGNHIITWDASQIPGLSSGIYFYKLEVDSDHNFSATRKLTLIK